MSDNATELCDRYDQLYTGSIADSLDELGYEPRSLPNSINPLKDDMSMTGIAFPVRGRPDPDCDFDENIRQFLRMLGDAPADSVIAYMTQDQNAAHLGELTTTALKAQECRGAVIDGGVRDIAHILDQDFPVFTKYRTPTDAPPRWRIEAWNVPIQIGDVEVRPGDILVGDADGIVCVPQADAEIVLERAEATVNEEDSVRKAIRDGVQPLDAYDEYGRF